MSMRLDDLNALHELLVIFRTSYPITLTQDEHTVAVLRAVRRRAKRWRQAHIDPP